ncbi:MAG: Holliday junction resolvase RuvX [Chloroflexi bacterium]|nr:Holliday junction resolvase RuvX [Anaerolineaceae bacterium]NMB90265.1 Holliday junction resolvase RuvX [Chloroflexota bacterium]
MKGPILAVDPGEKRIGVAISDPSASLARPLTVIRHVARLVDAAAVASLAAENHAVSIIVGQALDSEGNVGPAGRKAARFAEALRSQTEIPVELWDESGSTQRAREIQIRLGVPRQKRKGHLDEHAAAAILQSYLDENWSS